MNKEEFKKITEYLDKIVILHQLTGEPINKDLDISIKLSVAYEELELENEKLKEVIDKAIEYINNLECLHIGIGENEYNLDKMYGSTKNYVRDLLEILKEVAE